MRTKSLDWDDSTLLKCMCCVFIKRIRLMLAVYLFVYLHGSMSTPPNTLIRNCTMHVSERVHACDIDSFSLPFF